MLTDKEFYYATLYRNYVYSVDRVFPDLINWVIRERREYNEMMYYKNQVDTVNFFYRPVEEYLDTVFKYLTLLIDLVKYYNHEKFELLQSCFA